MRLLDNLRHTAAKTATAFIVSAAIVCGAFAGLFVSVRAMGFVKVRERGPDTVLLAAQVAEMQATLEAMKPPYDDFAANPIDEFAGLE